MTARRRTPARTAKRWDDASKASRWRSVALVLAGALTYITSFSRPFLYDDDLGIVSNENIRAWWDLPRVLSPVRESPVAGRPLVSLSLALNYALGGLDVRGYHAVNLAIHLACALLVFGIVRRTLRLESLRRTWVERADDVAFAVALLWVVHPLTSEVVDYVVQRTESLMAFFYLLTLYTSVRGLRGSRAWQVVAVVACACGMASKESMVTAPVAVVMYDAVFAFSSWRDALRVRWPWYAGLASTWAVLAALILPGPRRYSAGFSSGVTPWQYLLNQAVMVPRYLRLAIWPRGFVLFYGPAVPLRLTQVLGSALVVAALLGLTAAALRWRPTLGFLGLWFFLTLAPTSSIVPIATEVGAERRMYLPLIALCALAVIGLYRAWDAVAERVRQPA